LDTPLVTGLRCVVCEKVHPPGLEGTCPDCGREGILDVQYDYERVAQTLTAAALRERPNHILRYRELLPIEESVGLPPQPVGHTPHIPAPRLAEALGVADLLLKDDGRNPTASFKARASSVGVSRALSLGAETIACASTGNAASSLAGMAAGVGMPAVIFVPKAAPAPKVAQLLVFGARVFRVKGSYDQAYDLCEAACEAFGFYNRNCAVNPYLVEGKKTCGLEIAEALGDHMVDWVVMSVGDGCSLAGTWKGLVEMHRLGFIPRLPRILGVQAQGARPVMDAFESGESLKVIEPHTTADSISVGHPRNWRKAVAAVKAAQGRFVAVSDGAIDEAMVQSARLGGVFGEPAAAASVAGIAQAKKEGIINAGDRVLAVITGDGLKDIDGARRVAGLPMDVEPDLDALRPLLA
jgi:threonine synthase